MAGRSVHLTAAVFYTLHGAREAVKATEFDTQIRGSAAAVLVERDLRGDLHTTEIGMTSKKGAVTGAVLGAALTIVTGGAGLAVLAAGGALGGVAGGKARAGRLSTSVVEHITEALVPGTSALLVAGAKPLPDAALDGLGERGAELFRFELSPKELEALGAGEAASAEAMAGELARGAAARTIPEPPYRRIHVVVNPASGKDEAMINILNRVFRPYGIDWDVSITQKYGDAEAFARLAAASGYDLVAGYGGDGTQHEIANALMGSKVLMGVLPGGTGNGFANELGIPKSLAEAAEVLCTSRRTRPTDIVQLGEDYFIQRLYVGIEPEQQTSREMKDRYGTFAYAVTTYQRRKSQKEVNYRITIDGEVIEMPATKVYVVNAAQTGTGITVTGNFSASDDGLLDLFVLDAKNLETLQAAAERMINLDRELAGKYIWRGREITIETDPDQPVWTDGEYNGRTPVTMRVIPGGLKVVVPEAAP